MNDLINGCFEACGFLFILPSVVKLHREKLVRGVSWIHSGFFWSWGLWNLYYYPSLGQWWSCIGGILLWIANTVWLAQLIHYSRREHLHADPGT